MGISWLVGHLSSPAVSLEIFALAHPHEGSNFSVVVDLSSSSAQGYWSAADTMADPSTGHGIPPAATDGTSTQRADQNQLVADELPMSEDDISLAFRSSRIMLQHLNDRRQAPPHRRLPPRHRYQDSGRGADRLAPWSNRQDARQQGAAPKLCLGPQRLANRSTGRETATKRCRIERRSRPMQRPAWRIPLHQRDSKP